MGMVIKIPGHGISKYLTINLETNVLDDKVIIAFTLINRSKEKLSLIFRTGQQYDIIIKDASGLEIYRWSDGRIFAQFIYTLSLKENEMIENEIIWNKKDKKNKKVSEGKYIINVGFLVDAIHKGGNEYELDGLASSKELSVI